MFIQSLKTARSYLLATIIKNVFKALIPLINIAGLGFAVNALVGGNKMDDIFIIIIVYLGSNLTISLIEQGLSLWENNAMRKSSNLL